MRARAGAAPLARGSLVDRHNRRVDPPSNVEVPLDGRLSGLNGRDEVIEDRVRHGLVKGPLVAIGP